MSVSPQDSLRGHVIRLAEECLQGTATEEQVARLEHLLQTQPSARRYYLRFIKDSCSLRKWALAQTEQVVPLDSKRIPGPHSRDRRKLAQKTLLVAASLAAVFLFAIRLFDAPEPGEIVAPGPAEFVDTEPADSGPAEVRPENRPVIGSIVSTKDCLWSGDTQFDSGAQLRETQQLGLNAGIAHIRFQDGATVTLEGPANLEFLSAGSTRLRSGVLTVYVPPKAVGFRVRTDAIDVVDLGTSFGVVVNEGGETKVSVFSGRVEVTSPIAAVTAPRIVSRGECVRANPGLASIETSSFIEEPFSRPLKVETGVENTSGQCRWVAPQAIGGTLPEDSEQILVGLERRDLVLLNEFVPDLVPNPNGEGLATGKQAPIPAGTRVDCFVMQFRPKPDDIPRRGLSASGGITFDRPILGIIARSQLLAKTDDLFAGGEADVVTARRGGEYSSDKSVTISPREVDTVELISNDRRTIKVTANLRKHMDQVRILVEAMDERFDATPSNDSNPIDEGDTKTD